ncbi:ferrous iron transport protein B [Clostridium carnis]
MNMKIALVGNPNCGKTTMFNELTGSYQHVGNWPGVTVEKKEGKLKGNSSTIIMDLPGIYSLSPYTLEEVITRDYLLEEKPDVVINIVDASNLERNLFLTTQVLELGIPTIVALNMIDIVNKNNDKLDTEKLSKLLGCKVVETSALKGNGIKNLISAAVDLTKSKEENKIIHRFTNDIESALDEISVFMDKSILESNTFRWNLIKVFERDSKAIEKLSLGKEELESIENIIAKYEDILDDDSESIITNERYNNINKIIKKCYKKNKEAISYSDKLDKILTNKWIALPIFFAILWVIYYISITTVGETTIGWVEKFFEWAEGGVEGILVNMQASEWAVNLVTKGIIASIGAIFTYVPQLMILFLFLSLLEDSGYMARVAFIMDRIFRKFGLSGKSFIPMLIGTGCSIPGIMASRTIENEKDRKMTIMLTPFIPCGAKLPVFAMFIAMMFRGYSWVGPSIYLIAILSVILSGIILKRTRMFKGDPAPFVMELPNYKLPSAKGIVIHMWEKAKSFIKKAGTIIFVACTILWFMQSFDFSLNYLGEGKINESMLATIGESIKWIFIPLGFGDSWVPAVASITGLVAKEVVVATFVSIGESTPIVFTQVTAFSFMIFTIFAAPCFAAIGAMKKEFGSWKMTSFAVGYQMAIAYISATLVNLIGNAIFKGTSITEPQVLDIGLMEEASETAVVHGNIVLIIFGVILAIGLIVIIANKIKSMKEYSDIAA